jgi:hypothetical protein
VLEIASGEHKDAIQKLVCAVNEDQKQHLGTLDSSVSFANEKTDSNKSLVDLPSGTGNELKKDPSEIAPDSSSALPSKQQEICLVKPRESFTKDIEQSRTQTFAFPNSTWTQFWIIFKRTLLQGVRDPTLTQMRLVAHFAVGAIISLIYYGIGNDAGKIQSNVGFIFFTTMFMMFTAMMPTILTFPTEMSVLIRENLNYWYSLKAYYLAKTCADLPFQMMYTSLFVVAVYLLTGQPMDTNRLFMFLLINVLTALVAQSLGLLIGAGLSIESGVFLG